MGGRFRERRWGSGCGDGDYLFCHGNFGSDRVDARPSMVPFWQGRGQVRARELWDNVTESKD